MDAVTDYEGPLSETERSDIDRRLEKFRLIRAQLLSLEECLTWVQEKDRAGFQEDRSNWLAAIKQHDISTSIEIAIQLFEFYLADDEIERTRLMEIWQKLAERANAKSRSLAILLHQLGILETSQGNLPGGQEYLLKSIRLQEQLGDVLMLGNDYYELGLVYRNRGNYQDAWDAFNKSIRYARETENLKTVIYSQGQLANILALQSHFVEALEILRQSMEIWNQFPTEADRDLRHTTLHTLGRIYIQNGQFRDAKEVLLESLDLKEKVQERFDATLRTRAMLAEACLNLGEFEDAECCLTEEMTDRAEKIGSYLYAASAFKVLSQLKFVRRDFVEAKRLANRAMTSAQSSNTPLTKFEVALWLLALYAQRFDVPGLARVFPYFFQAFLGLRLSPLEILKLAFKRLAVTLNPMHRIVSRR